MGESIYLVQCSQCHGNTGDGLDGRAQDFTTRMSKEQVLDAINNGSNQLGYAMGAMPAGMASGEQAEEIAVYVSGGMKGEQPASFAACSSCHGADGKGSQLVGAPNLTDDIWLYGGSSKQIEFTLKHGRNGKMPAHLEILGNNAEAKIHLLTTYVYSLSHQQ